MNFRFVVSSHIRHHPSKKNEFTGNFESTDDFTIKQEILRKYIVYARQNVHPKLQNMDKDKVANIYSQLRQESLVCVTNLLSVKSFKNYLRQLEVLP